MHDVVLSEEIRNPHPHPLLEVLVTQGILGADPFSRVQRQHFPQEIESGTVEVRPTAPAAR